MTVAVTRQKPRSIAEIQEKQANKFQICTKIKHADNRQVKKKKQEIAIIQKLGTTQTDKKIKR